MDDVKTGKYMTGSGTAVAVPCRAYNLVLSPGGAACYVLLLDGGSGGTERVYLAGVANGPSVVWSIDDGLEFLTDCYLALSGAGAVATVAFTLKD